MVLLTMTEAIVEALQYTNGLSTASTEIKAEEPPTDNPAIGEPISHGQVLELFERLEAIRKAEKPGGGCPAHHLDQLLRSSKVYIEPPKTKPEQSSEYKALMARLRREEESRAYEHMINPPLPVETFAQRFPHAPQNPFGRDQITSAEQAEELTYADINRQVALIFNILISIVACSAAIWMAAHQWSVPSRLGLSMSGGGTVGIAEVVVYTGYLRRIKEAKTKEGKKVEVKEIIDTWVIGGPGGGEKRKVEEKIREKLDEVTDHANIPKLVPDHPKSKTNVSLRKRKP